MSPSSAGRFSTTASPGKPPRRLILKSNVSKQFGQDLEATPVFCFVLFFIFYLFLAVLGLCCGTCRLSLVAVCGLLIAVASPVVEHGP